MPSRNDPQLLSASTGSIFFLNDTKDYPMRQLFLLGFVFLLVFAGCKRPPVIKSVKVDEKRDTVAASPFRSAMETFRYPDNPRSPVDWSRFREGLAQLKPYFEQDNVRLRARLSPAEREFLQKQTEIFPEAMTELDGVTFRDADAHYLDECYLLRDIARSANVVGVTGLARAEHYFGWTMRNVILHEQVDRFAPPAFVLRRGYAGALERAVVFLALLRQAEIDGCILQFAKDADAPFLVGVVDPKTEKLNLFDTRLGLALRGKDQRSILTLDELRSDVSLGARSMITADQLKKMTARVVVPLQGLAPRMLELEKGMKPYEAVVLHVDASRLHAVIAKAASPTPTTMWTQSAPADLAPSWWLTQFISVKEGGKDIKERALTYVNLSGPSAQVGLNFVQVNLTQALIPPGALGTLVALSEDLVNKYDVQPREMYLHGHTDSMIRRLERMNKLTKNDLFAGLAEDNQFRTELTEWQKTVRLVYARAGSDDARQRAQGQAEMQEIWRKDPVISILLDLEKDEKTGHEEREKAKPTTLARILAVGLRDFFDFESARMVACVNHERAENAQAAVDAATKPTAAAKERAAEAWSLAKTSWSSYYLSRIALDFTIEQRVEQARAQPILVRVPLLEAIHRDTQRILNAKICLSECLYHTQGRKEANAYLASVKSEIEKIEKKGLMASLVSQTLAELRQFSGPQANALVKRAELLETDWKTSGSTFWLKQQIDARIAGWR